MGCEVLSEGPEMWPDLLPLAVPLACAAHADRVTWGARVRGLQEGVLCRCEDWNLSGNRGGSRRLFGGIAARRARRLRTDGAQHKATVERQRVQHDADRPVAVQEPPFCLISPACEHMPIHRPLKLPSATFG